MKIKDQNRLVFLLMVEIYAVFGYISSMKTTATRKRGKVRDYDAAWKDVIETHFEPFMQFFYPHIHKDIDFSIAPEILSQELRKIEPSSKLGKRRADILIKVSLKNGKTRCIFIHIEVQGQADSNFPLRMFIYYYRIFEKYLDQGVEIISLALLTDKDPDYLPDSYSCGGWGFSLNLKYPLVKVIDYQEDEEKKKQLETSTNPMALAVRAQLNSFKTMKGQHQKTFDIKYDLIRQFIVNGYDKNFIKSFYYFIDLIFILPRSYERQLFKKIEQLEEEHNMPGVTSWEKIAKDDGKKIGKELGKELGKQIANEKNARVLLKRGVAIDIIAESTGFSKEELKKLAETSH